MWRDQEKNRTARKRTVETEIKISSPPSSYKITVIYLENALGSDHYQLQFVSKVSQLLIKCFWKIVSLPSYTKESGILKCLKKITLQGISNKKVTQVNMVVNDILVN